MRLLPLIPLALATAVSAAGAQAPAPLDTAAIIATAHADIDAANDAWIPGMNARDAGMITAAYADSGIFIGPDGTVTRGRAAITAMYAARFPRLPRTLRGGVQTDRIIVVSPELLIEYGHAWVEIPATAAGAPPRRSEGAYLTVWHREADGHWRITRNIAL